MHYLLCLFFNFSMYVLRLILPNFLKTLLDRFIFVKAEAYLSPPLAGNRLILDPNNLATSKIE